MATLREYFASESSTYFAQLGDQINRFDTARPEPQELLRLVRALRGSAHLAREKSVYRAALGLEAAARLLASGALRWNGDVSTRARETLADLRLLAGGETEAAATARVNRVLLRWQQAGVTMRADGALQADGASPSSRQFREFAAHEVAGIIVELDGAIAELAHDPRNREVLKAVLRRQRALLGAAGLDEIGIVAETLRAIEDLVRLIVKLNVAVRDEWAAVLRAAREVLADARDPLRKGLDPVATHALSKLRTLRTELLERFGEGDNPTVAGGNLGAASRAPAAPRTSKAPAPAKAMTEATPRAKAAAAAAATPDEIVPIEQLCYSGEPALRRALELRAQLESLAGDNSDARAAVEEVFDLIRLGVR